MQGKESIMAVPCDLLPDGFLFLGLSVFKGLSHCHEFGYDMRQVNNWRHIIGKSKRCCHMSAVGVHCRHISYIVTECLRDF